jgi:dienelactone hydrolase
MHAAYKSREEVIDGFLARPLTNSPTPALVLLHGYRGVDDTQRAVTRRFLRMLPFVTQKKIALSGFCMGGGLALLGLARSNKFAAGVIFYQSLFPDPEELKGIKVPLQCHYGTRDENTTKAEIEMFKGILTKYDKKFEIHMYKGAGHAFLNSPVGRSGPNRTAAEQSFFKSCRWLRKKLV